MPLDKYEKRRDSYSRKFHKRSKQMSKISNLRLASFLISIIGGLAFYLMGQFIICGAVFIGFIKRTIYSSNPILIWTFLLLEISL